MEAFEERYPKPEAAPGLMSECPLVDWNNKKEVWQTALEWVLNKHHEDQWEFESVVYSELNSLET